MFGFPRACLPINSILCPLLLFSYCVFSEITYFLLPSVLSFAFLSKNPRVFLAGDFVSQHQPFFSEFLFGTCTLLLFSLCCACFFIALISDLFWENRLRLCVECWCLLIFWICYALTVALLVCRFRCNLVLKNVFKEEKCFICSSWRCS